MARHLMVVAGRLGPPEYKRRAKQSEAAAESEKTENETKNVGKKSAPVASRRGRECNRRRRMTKGRKSKRNTRDRSKKGRGIIDGYFFSG